LQLEKGVTDSEDRKQKAVCMERYRRRDDDDYRQSSDIDIEREDECGICMEMNSKIVLPNCNHAMCLKCYREWYSLPLLPLSICVCAGESPYFLYQVFDSLYDCSLLVSFFWFRELLLMW
jgi:hypothetical protein